MPPKLTIAEIQSQRADLEQRLDAMRSREGSASLSGIDEQFAIAKAALARATEMRAAAEREAFILERDEMMAAARAASEESRRLQNEFAKRRSAVQAADALAKDPEVLKLANTPEGAIALVEAQNGVRTAVAHADIAQRASEEAYRAFTKANAEVLEFENRHGIDRSFEDKVAGIY